MSFIMVLHKFVELTGGGGGGWRGGGGVSSQRVRHFNVFVCQNWMKNYQVMTIYKARAQKWRWPHFLRCDRPSNIFIDGQAVS